MSGEEWRRGGEEGEQLALVAVLVAERRVTEGSAGANPPRRRDYGELGDVPPFPR